MEYRIKSIHRTKKIEEIVTKQTAILLFKLVKRTPLNDHQHTILQNILELEGWKIPGHLNFIPTT